MKRSIDFFILGFVLVSGCGGPKKPSESNFRAAINRYLSKNGKACIPVVQSFPADIPVARLNESSGTPLEMAALEKAGLLRSSNTMAVADGMLDALRGPTPARPVKRYELTAEGQKSFRKYLTLIGPMNGFCYGQEQVDSIVKWDAPSKQETDFVTAVTYTSKLEQIAGWANQPDIDRAFPVIKATVDETNINQIVGLHLTNRGWEVNGF